MSSPRDTGREDRADSAEATEPTPTRGPAAARARISGAVAEPSIAPWRIRLFAGGTAVLLAVAVGYGVYAAHRHAAAVASSPKPLATLSLTGTPKIMFLSTAIGAGYQHLAEVPAADPGAKPSITPTSCQRSYAAAETLVCLQAGGSLTGTEYAQVYNDSSGTPKQVKSVQLPGIPSRARVSADGEMVAWTVFVSGDSYNGPEFSTRTGILDLRTGTLTDNLETFTAYVDGSVYHAVDINYWGVTFTSTDGKFYATMGSAGKTWLMQGNLQTHTMTSIVENVECPSLSPDGTHIVFKKRISTSLSAPWRLYVLDLATLKETPLAETRSIDDQAAWLGNNTVMYDVPQKNGSGYDIWEVPADGTGTPKLIIPDGFSPTAIGG
jgi:WD40 repeat protein